MKKSLLWRDFMHAELYDKSFGYFSRELAASRLKLIGQTSTTSTTEFYKNESDFERNVVANVYENSGEWTTPTELFRPHYAESMCNWFVSSARKLEREQRKSINVVEIGGGCGSFALDFLTKLERSDRELYDAVRFTSVELSAPLADAQQTLLKNSQHNNRWSIVRDSFVNVQRSQLKQQQQQAAADLNVVFAFEVLDNCSHDKIVITDLAEALRNKDSMLKLGRFVKQTVVTNDRNELFEALNDDTLYRVVQLYLQNVEQYFTQEQLSSSSSINNSNSFVVYLPTVSYQFARQIEYLFGRSKTNQQQQQSKLMCLFADFDEFGERQIYGRNAPLIQSRRSSSESFESFTLQQFLAKPKGFCDIMFATDFRLFSRFFDDANKQQKFVIRKQKEFLREFGEQSVISSSTRRGYNAFLDYYPNMSVCIGELK